MNSLSRKLVLIFSLPLFGAGALLAASEASAAVKLSGCLKWFHPGYPGDTYWPLKYTTVDVEWDGAGADKKVTTNGNGCYEGSVRDAWAGNGHDMNASVYAERAFKGTGSTRSLYVRVFENQIDRKPTWVNTRTKHINDNSSGTINQWFGNNREFGGTRLDFKTGNLIGASRYHYYWNIAAADILGRFYDRMNDSGFKQRRSVDVIAPAIGGTAYFNFATNNINMTASATPSQDPDGFKGWVGTVLHEGTHALHAHSSPSLTPVAPGLMMPSVHSWDHETNPNLAWTEGFAAFLPVAYLTSWGGLGKYAFYREARGTSDGAKVTASSKIEDHTTRKQPGYLTATSPSQFHLRGSASSGGSEAYVAGFLWDLIDNSSNQESISGLSNWRSKIPGTAIPRANCQLENTSARAYRNLPANSAVLRDAESNQALRLSTDCLKLPLQNISALISTKMFPALEPFAAALVQGQSNAVKYEVLKTFANNGLLGAVPSVLTGMKNWTLSQSSTSLLARAGWGDGGRPSNATSAQDRAREFVKIDIPVSLSGATDEQFKSTKCRITTSSVWRFCNTSLGHTGANRVQGKNIYIGYLKKSDYCTGTGTGSATVGVAEKAPIYVVLDDGVNPIAMRLNGICSANIVS